MDILQARPDAPSELIGRCIFENTYQQMLIGLQLEVLAYCGVDVAFLDCEVIPINPPDGFI